MTGLHYIPSFIPNYTRRRLLGHTQNLLDSVRASLSPVESIHIPQPIRSQQHNLAEERTFRRVRVRDSLTGMLIKGEHFEEYGSREHSLTYFQRNINIPGFAQEVIGKLKNLHCISEVARQRGKAVQDLEWRLTVNEYKDFPADQVSVPFPWHTDIASNGDATAILTLQHEATLELAAHPDALAEFPTLPTEENPHAVLLEEGSCLTSSGLSRWRCLHRILATGPNPERRPRVTLVFGCK